MSTTGQAIIVRIVFDGSPYAGKTTAARALGGSLDQEVFTAPQEGTRTAWFDWVTYTGGRHNGHPIRVELVTVPGQDHLSDRRRHLLRWSDVVVFVADTSRAAFAESADRFRSLDDELRTIGARPVIVIANKRDLPDAVDLDEVRAGLALDDAATLVEAVATTRTGVRHAFVFAVRAAIDAGVERTEPTDPEQLLADMTASCDTSAVPDAAAPLPTLPTPPAMPALPALPALPAVPASRLRLRAGAAEDGAVVLRPAEWQFLADLVGDRQLPHGDGLADPSLHPVAAQLVARGIVELLPGLDPAPTTSAGAASAPGPAVEPAPTTGDAPDDDRSPGDSSADDWAPPRSAIARAAAAFPHPTTAPTASRAGTAVPLPPVAPAVDQPGDDAPNTAGVALQRARHRALRELMRTLRD